MSEHKKFRENAVKELHNKINTFHKQSLMYCGERWNKEYTMFYNGYMKALCELAYELTGDTKYLRNYCYGNYE